MNWKPLTSLDQLDTIRQESNEKPVLIFKHSTTCNISAMVLNRLERNWDVQDMEPHVDAYFLDLKTYRQVSNEIAERFDVEHESPQVLIIRHGESVFDRSHAEITYQEIRDAIKN